MLRLLPPATHGNSRVAAQEELPSSYGDIATITFVSPDVKCHLCWQFGEVVDIANAWTTDLIPHAQFICPDTPCMF